MARYLPVYLPREPIALPIGSLRVYVHALAVSLCNRTTGTRIPTSSLYFPAHKFISWKIGWPTCVGSAPRRRSPPISLAKKRANRREIVRSFFTFVHSREGELEKHARIFFDIRRISKKDYWKKRNWVGMMFVEKICESIERDY